MRTPKPIKLDELRAMDLDMTMIDRLPDDEVIWLLQGIKRELPNHPSVKRHTVESIARLNGTISRELLTAVWSMANNLDQPVVKR